MIAAVYNTPLPDVWSMTFRNLAAYAASAADVLSLTNPLIEKKEKPITDASAIEAVARAMGVPVRDGTWRG